MALRISPNARLHPTPSSAPGALARSQAAASPWTLATGGQVTMKPLNRVRPSRPRPERGAARGAEVPQVRVRNLTWRQAQQLAELTVLNERLAAGNKGSSVIAVRKRIEWLRARRHVWERIYNYVTKQDAAATLAVIEDANSKASDQRALAAHATQLPTAVGAAH